MQSTYNNWCAESERISSYSKQQQTARTSTLIEVQINALFRCSVFRSVFGTYTKSVFRIVPLSCALQTDSAWMDRWMNRWLNRRIDGAIDLWVQQHNMREEAYLDLAAFRLATPTLRCDPEKVLKEPNSNSAFIPDISSVEELFWSKAVSRLV